MQTETKNSIKSRIKEVISSNDVKNIVLKVGLFGTELNFTSKKEFGNRILIQLEKDNIKDIVFEGVEDDTLRFKSSYISNTNLGNNRGYGQGRYMAD